MIVISLDGCGRFLEAYVIKASERSAIDILDRMIWYQKVFLPSHKYKVSTLKRLIVKSIRIERLGILTKRFKFTLQNKITQT